jgi:hypothetical protein
LGSQNSCYAKALHGYFVFVKCPPRLIKMQDKHSKKLFMVNGFGNKIHIYVDK